MKDASKLPDGVSKDPTDVLTLTQVDSDIFLDIFQQTYSIIVKALSKKIAKQQNHAKLSMQESMFNKFKGMKVNVA